MEPALLVIPAFVILAVLILVWTFRRSGRMVERWAQEKGYEVIEKRWLMLGGRAFWWRKSKSHMVYYVTVRDPEGRIRSAYVRCGSWLLGLLSDHVTVEWDE